MTLLEALDYLASNCPSVFAPISNEIQRLDTENQALVERVELTENAVNEIILGGM